MQTNFKTTQDWLNFDRDHLWHPYTSMKDPLPCYPIESAQSVYLKLSDGSELIDGMSSWWSALHGYNHPKLNQAAIGQIEKMSHVMFGGIAHQPASQLGARLLALTPEAFQHIFLADSGSISVEVAIKMALQYWQSSRQREKQTLLTIRGGYHGDPFTCMSVSDPINSQHDLFPSTIAKHLFVPRPETTFRDEWDPQDIAVFKRSIETHHNSIAAVIVEPIVQGAGGMRFYHPEYLRQIRALCDHHNVLLIFDEIATGFGRTGKMFALEYAGILPDILCLGKALTGGMMTLAATLTTHKVAMTISNGETPVLMHGPTFMGNPLACAVACASLDILTNTGEGSTYPEGWQARVKSLEQGLTALYEVKPHKAVADVRILGGIGVIEMKQPVDVAKVQKSLVQKGVWVRPFGHLIYVMPPYIISKNQLGKLCRSMIETINEIY